MSNELPLSFEHLYLAYSRRVFRFAFRLLHHLDGRGRDPRNLPVHMCRLEASWKGKGWADCLAAPLAGYVACSTRTLDAACPV